MLPFVGSVCASPLELEREPSGFPRVISTQKEPEVRSPTNARGALLRGRGACVGVLEVAGVGFLDGPRRGEGHTHANGTDDGLGRGVGHLDSRRRGSNNDLTIAASLFTYLLHVRTKHTGPLPHPTPQAKPTMPIELPPLPCK